MSGAELLSREELLVIRGHVPADEHSLVDTALAYHDWKWRAEVETLNAANARRWMEQNRVRAEQLERERDEAREIVAQVNNSVIGSYGWFIEPSCVDAVEKLKDYSKAQWRRAEAAERERDEAQEAVAARVNIENVDEVLNRMLIGFAVERRFAHDPDTLALERMAEEWKHQALNTFCLLASEYITRAEAAEARCAAQEQEIERLRAVALGERERLRHELIGASLKLSSLTPHPLNEYQLGVAVGYEGAASFVRALPPPALSPKEEQDV